MSRDMPRRCVSHGAGGRGLDRHHGKGKKNECWCVRPLVEEYWCAKNIGARKILVRLVGWQIIVCLRVAAQRCPDLLRMRHRVS